MIPRSKAMDRRFFWVHLLAGFGAGLMFWLVFFVVMNFYMFADVPSFVPRYLAETIVQRPHVPMRFGIVGLLIGAIIWGIRRLLAKRPG